MEMAQLIRLSLALLCCSAVVLSTETGENNYNDVVQFVLNWYNENSNSQYVYNSAKLLNAYKKNDSVPLYLLQLEVATSCNRSQNCQSSSLICEVGVRENLQTHTKEVLTDRAKCAKKEIEPVIPSFGHGFSEENITDEIRSIAAFAIQQSQNNGANKRSVIDIMSVKRQVVGNATTLYLTLKVTKNEGGDAVQFELCEAEVNQTGEMAWESSLSCFPLNGLSSETPINAEDITTVAERAADEMDSLSYSEFTLKLKDVLKAETTVTPGSEGTLTNLELRLLPTVCLKNVDVENDAYGLYSNRLCSENSNKRLICSVISWDRPWVDDTLYSEPSCRIETVANQSTNAAIPNINPDVMMNDGMEPENEEVLIPAVEHHSIPVVEELDPIIEQILPDIEKPVASDIEEPLIPVVEEPIVAKHIYCTGCPIDLDVNNPALDEFVEQALASIDESSNGQNMYRATRITKAQKQVVNGVKYILYLEVAETICRKDSGQNRGTCETSNNEIRTCIVEFLEKPWIDSSRVIISNNCTRYDNDLENEIKPHFVSHSHLARQEIFDYLDEMEEPKPIPNSEDFPSYGKDSLYPPESEPTNHPVENDAEEIEIKTTTDEHIKSEKTVMESSDTDTKTDSPVESEESKESEENQTEKRTAENNSGESDESSEESRENENQEEKIDKIAEYITENRNRRETSLTPHVGALKEVADSEKELVDKLAQIAVNTLDEIDEDDKKRVVLEILSAQKQIVNGIMYHLLLRIVSTSCSELGQSDPSCVNEQLSPIRICKVELHRSFASNSQLDAKVVKSECTIENENATEKKLRKKRDVGVVSGGIYTANTSDPYISQMADFAVTEIDKGTNSLYRQCVVSIDTASKQVVTGYNIYLTLTLRDSVHRKGENITDGCQQDANSETINCHVTIWDRPWIENSQQLTSSNCSENGTRVKRDTSETDHPRLIGGPIDADTNDTYIQELAGTALEEVDRRSNAIYKQQIVRIIEAKKQVVAGIKVRLTMEVGFTNCRKGGRQENQECQLNENSNNQICYVEIWDRSWLSDRRITNFSCSPAEVTATSASITTEAVVNRKKRDTLGGHSTANTSDPYIQEVANTALLDVDRRSNALHKQQIVRIISATKQVVAGLKIHLVMELGYTTCRKGRNVTENCQLSENSNNQICHAEVWDRPWLQDRRVTNISCSPVSAATITTTNTEVSDELESTNRLKRHVGGFSKLEVDDPYVLEMAKTALVEYDKKSNALFKQKIVRIIEAERQVVAGTLTRLTIEIGYSKCRKGHEDDVDTCELRENSKNQICRVEVWDRPWLNTREIKKSSCNPSSSTRSKRKSLKNDFHLEAFQNFIEKFNKKYSSNAEFKKRFHIFRANLKKIDLLQRTEQGTATYGITQFADLSKKEFKKYHLGLNPNLKETNEIPMQKAVIPDVELPKEFDWRHFNAVTEVKNQGSCGSCWAFSVTGNIEGQWKINKGQLISLSEQELVDCDKLDDGCNGGLPENAYKAIEKLGGLETEGDYPYEGDDEKCHFKKSDVQVTIQGSLNITKNETKMAQWLYKNGPMSIGINANAMQFYMGGVSHPWKFLCNGDNLDHGVLIVGYGVHKTSILHKTLPYWTIKNSWGKGWGEQGYYRVYRGDGTCGVNQMVTSAIVG